MARTRGKLKEWASAKDDLRESFAQIGRSVLQHPAFLRLYPPTRFVYICMIESSGGQREFSFPRAIYRRYGIAESTFDRAKKQLIREGFIRVLQSGASNKTPNKYQFSYDWKLKK